ncbi:MAG TPA: phosphohistidine phosphatase SixA [Methylophilaceae bacterium]|jgi:phosphohistidine phosphatase
MELILWRHAEAEDGAPDMQRKLTDKGRLQALRMGEWLKQRLPRDTRILVSPSLRTQQTALALSHSFETIDTLAPGANVRHVLEAAGWPNANGTVVIVGHQPTLGEVAAKLLANANDSWSVKKGAIWWFAQRGQGEFAETVLKAALVPNML